MVTVLLADGMVQPSRASEHIDALWDERTIKTILEVPLRQTRSERVTQPMMQEG